MEEEIGEDGLHHDDVSVSRKQIVTQLIATVIGLTLFVLDMYLHKIDPPVPQWVYGVFIAVALGKEEFLSMFGINFTGGKKR